MTVNCPYYSKCNHNKLECSCCANNLNHVKLDYFLSKPIYMPKPFLFRGKPITNIHREEHMDDK